MIKKMFIGALLVASSLFLATANAATSVSWLTPADGSSYPEGTSVSPTGNASASGTIGGAGLDLILVLDSSGSMRGTSSGKSLRQWQAEAAIALVNSLPTATTSVGIVEFDSNANLVTGLTPLTPTSNITALETAINSVDASGGTDIYDGIIAGTTELVGARHTTGRNQMMVVMSDGETFGADPATAAANAITAGIEAIHTVGLPGHSVSTMQSIATAGNGVYTSVDDLTTLTGLFDGTGGNLVGLDRVDVELPDGTLLTDVATDALGNFAVGPYALAAGANTFTAYAYGSDGTSASADLTLYGTTTGPGVSVPTPAPLALLSLGILGMAVTRRRKHR